MGKEITYSVKVKIEDEEGVYQEEVYQLEAVTDSEARRERDKKYPDAELWFFRRADHCRACLDD